MEGGGGGGTVPPGRKVKRSNRKKRYLKGTGRLLKNSETLWSLGGPCETLRSTAKPAPRDWSRDRSRGPVLGSQGPVGPVPGLSTGPGVPGTSRGVPQTDPGVPGTCPRCGPMHMGPHVHGQNEVSRSPTSYNKFRWLAGRNALSTKLVFNKFCVLHECTMCDVGHYRSLDFDVP
jgi:hypothetical protein